MKKILALVMAAAMALSLAACGAPPARPRQPARFAACIPGCQPADSVPAADTVKEAAMGYFANWPEDGHMIGVADLFAKMDAGEEMLILDVRQPDAYAEGHLKGAVNVPFGSTLAESLSKIPDDVQLYVNCYTGQTSSADRGPAEHGGQIRHQHPEGLEQRYFQGRGLRGLHGNHRERAERRRVRGGPAMQEAVTKYFADTGVQQLQVL